MEAKINKAEILKDKPQGTKLHDLLYNKESRRNRRMLEVRKRKGRL